MRVGLGLVQGGFHGSIKSGLGFLEGSLEVKLPTASTDEKQRRKSEEIREEKRRKRKIKEEKVIDSKKKERAGARKGKTVAKHCVFPIFCGSGGSK